MNALPIRRAVNRLNPAALRSLALVAVALAIVLVFALLPSQSQAQSQLALGGSGYGKSQKVSLGLNKSMIVDLPTDVGEVIVSQPSITQLVMRTKTRAIVQGIGAGETNIFFLDGVGNPIAVLEVLVAEAPSNLAQTLQATLARVIPGSSIRVEAVEITGSTETTNRIVLSGAVQSQDDAQKAFQIAAQFAGGEANVASVVNVAGGQQVMLKVVIAEVSREAVKQLGINLNASFGMNGLTTGLVTNNPLGGASGVVAPNTLTAGLNVGPVSISGTLQALERRGAVRTLAEPTLTALSGEEATFLAGGEFPVPTGVSDGQMTFTFKEFGVKLTFTPTVRSNGVIGLVVDTSVSELTTEGGFTAGGVTIPATSERQAKTSVELGSGMTLAIAGLLQDKVRQQINALPGLGNIPILGALFRSRDFIHSQTELVILVTPYLAQPSYQAGPLPTDQFVVPGDAEATFLGHLESRYGVNGGIRGTYDGSVGFILD